jgi:hypothetical protein
MANDFLGANPMTLETAKEDALSKHLDCSYAEVYNGLNWALYTTWVVKLWRNEECYLAGDPPKYIVEGYLTDQSKERLNIEKATA